MDKHLMLIYQNTAIPFIFEEAESLNIRITLIVKPGDTTIQYSAVHKQIELDIYDEKTAFQEVEKLHQTDPIDGVMTLSEGAMIFTSKIAEKLSLPKPGIGSYLPFRDKKEMRNQFDHYGINNPNYMEIDNINDTGIINEWNYPVVIKPKTGYSSLGVIRANNVQEYEQSLQEVQNINIHTLNHISVNEDASLSGIIVEEFIDGPEYVAESFVVDGDVAVLSIGYKGNPKGPYFEESIYIAPAQLPEPLQKEVVRQVTKANIALGVSNGPTHTELRIGKDEQPYILEIGVRIGGLGVSHYIVKESTGVNLAELSLRYAVGEKVKLPLLTPKPKRVAGNYIIPISGEGEIKSIKGWENILSQEETKRVVQFLKPGDVVKPYPEFSGYPGFVLTAHRNYEECVRFFEWLEDEISIEYK